MLRSRYLTAKGIIPESLKHFNMPNLTKRASCLLMTNDPDYREALL